MPPATIPNASNPNENSPITPAVASVERSDGSAVAE
jgi:hypothetical protein